MKFINFDAIEEDLHAQGYRIGKVSTNQNLESITSVDTSGGQFLERHQASLQSLA